MAEEQAQPAATGMAAFFTRGPANEGVKLQLHAPDGTETEHWLRIRGVDSDVFRQAEAKQRRRAVELAREKPDDAAQDALWAEARLELLGALVISWSLPEECTPENVRTLLVEAPQIASAIDRLTARRSLFFRRSTPPSSPSPSTSSG